MTAERPAAYGQGRAVRGVRSEVEQAVAVTVGAQGGFRGGLVP